MIRYAFSAIAAFTMTVGVVSALNAETPAKVTIDQRGDYCVTTAAPTGTHIGSTECKSVDEWAREGVTFSRKPSQVASR